MLDSQKPSVPTAPALSQRINTATRSLHTQLNALVLVLLPLSLPPYAPDATLYAQGLRHFLPIYEAFESAFRLLLTRSRNEYGVADARLMKALGESHVPQLERSGRLRMDIERILGADHDNPWEEAQAPRLHKFTAHIRASIELRPHLLLAYTWLLYMALFNGGRVIRAQLQQAGPAFWDNRPLRNEADGIDADLRFWELGGQEDGEDVKIEFKQRFAEVELCLTEREKEDVVLEAFFVMQTMFEVIEDISEDVGRRRPAKQAGLVRGQDAQIGEEGTAVQSAEEDEPSTTWLVLRHVLPMGMAELVEGARKAVMTGVRSL